MTKQKNGFTPHLLNQAEQVAEGAGFTPHLLNRAKQEAERAGFTLVEIMIVVAIISLLAAISIPNLLRSRINANETATIAAIKTVVSAMEEWRFANRDFSGVTFPALANPSLGPYGGGPSYLSSAFNSVNPSIHGYMFSLAVTSPQTYYIYGWPQSMNFTGTRYFIYCNNNLYIFRGGAIYAYGASTGGTWKPVE